MKFILLILLICHVLFFNVSSGQKTIDEDEEYQEWNTKDSIRQIEYAGDCEFKTRNINNCWNRSGSFPIDSLPEIFSCKLKEKGVDTIILCKFITDFGGITKYEKAFVLWIENGTGYIKEYYFNESFVLKQSKNREFDVKYLVDKFFELRIQQIKSIPDTFAEFSHSIGYCMQVMTPDIFYCERIPTNKVDYDSLHPKSVWWKLVEEKITENN